MQGVPVTRRSTAPSCSTLDNAQKGSGADTFVPTPGTQGAGLGPAQPSFFIIADSSLLQTARSVAVLERATDALTTEANRKRGVHPTLTNGETADAFRSCFGLALTLAVSSARDTTRHVGRTTVAVFTRSQAALGTLGGL